MISPIAERAVTADRLLRLAGGLTGDAKAPGGGFMELGIRYGPGYRVYFERRGPDLVLLLCGGDKRRQARDVERARALAKEA